MNKKLPLVLIFSVAFIFLVRNVSAHCPLCAMGAGAAAVGAVWLGISKVVVGLFIGAFAMSMGMWFSKIPKKEYVKFQKTIIILVIFLTTIIPLLPIFSYNKGIFIDLAGDYGSLLNRTYVINASLIGSLLGGVIVFISPTLNKKIKSLRNGKGIPFQGILVTFSLLILIALIIQLTIK